MIANVLARPYTAKYFIGIWQTSTKLEDPGVKDLSGITRGRYKNYDLKIDWLLFKRSRNGRYYFNYVSVEKVKRFDVLSKVDFQGVCYTFPRIEGDIENTIQVIPEVECHVDFLENGKTRFTFILTPNYTVEYYEWIWSTLKEYRKNEIPSASMDLCTYSEG